MRFVGGARGIGQLFRDLKDDAIRLVRQEVRLAKAEMRENISAATRNAMLLIAGVVVGLLAAMALTAALCIGVTMLWALAVGMSVALWLGPLSVGVVYAVAAGIMIQVGRKRLNAKELAPTMSGASLREDARLVREHLP